MSQFRRLSLPLCLIALCAAASDAAPTPRPRLLRVQRPYDVKQYRLLVQLDERTGAYRTRTAIRFVATQAMSELRLDAVGLVPGGAWLDDGDQPPGQPGLSASLKVQVQEDPVDEVRGTLTVALPLHLQPGSEATVEIETRSRARTDQNGFFVISDPDNPQRGPLYLTHFEPLGARRFFPCHDDPADKATFDVTVETAERLAVLANGRQVSSVRVPGAPGRKRVRYTMVRPMSTYLLALAVGPFDRETLDDGGVPLDAHVARGRKDDARYALGVARDALRLYERLWDMPFPFERYGQVEFPSFPSGAMENASLTFSSREALLLPSPGAQLARLRIAGTVSHELAHQWFGDLVTMDYWDDVWLSEALATYATRHALSDRFGADLSAVRVAADLHDGYFRTENGPRSHPIVNRELRSLEDAFDSITYTKGAQVLWMIEELLGPERMQAGLSAYLHRHAFGNATAADLLGALGAAQSAGLPPHRPGLVLGPAAVADVSVALFAESWLQARGYPVLTVSARYDKVRRLTMLQVRQRPNRATEDTRWHVRLPVSLHHRGTRPFDIDALLVLSPATGRTPVTFAVPTPSAPDWISWNRGGLALAEIEAPDVDDSTWAQAALMDPDATSRLLALLQLLRPALSGSLSRLSRAAEEALLQALQNDPSAAVRFEIAQRLARTRGILPERLRAAVLSAAQEPGGVDPADPLAVVMARAGAVELCGRIPGPEGEALLSQMIQDPALSIDLLGPAATGLSRRGTDSALSALQRGAAVQKKRGPAFVSPVLAAYGALGNPRYLPDLVRVVREGMGHGNLVREVLRRLFYNDDLRQSPELPAAIASLVLGPPQLSEGEQARALQAIEGLRTREAQAALTDVQKRARTARIRLLAGLMLEKTFG